MDEHERLSECGLTNLETRMSKVEQIEVFKILNGYENIDRLDIRKHSFSQRTINEWNTLTTDCITASSVNMFKNNVETYVLTVNNESMQTCNEYKIDICIIGGEFLKTSLVLSCVHSSALKR